MRDHLYYPQDGDDGLDAHQVNELLLAGSTDPDYVVDIGAHVEKKVEAVLCHASQLGNRSPEELRKAWEQRMRTSRDGQLTESFKWVRIRRPRRQQGQEQEAAKTPQAPAEAPAQAGQSQNPH